jgi:hypothetical protein
VIGGVAVSTILTLVVIPFRLSFYRKHSAMDDSKSRKEADHPRRNVNNRRMFDDLKKLQELCLKGSVATPTRLLDRRAFRTLLVYSRRAYFSGSGVTALEDLKKQNIHRENLFPSKNFLFRRLGPVDLAQLL